MEFLVPKNGLLTVTYLDPESFEKIKHRKWFINNRNYVACSINRKYTLLHRFILDLEHGNKTCVDHINANRLDNRLSNFRKCTFAENLRNQRVYKNNISGYKGVNKRLRSDGQFSYRARIRHEGHLFQLGTFSNPEDAALAYNHKALELFGEFASLNVLPQVKGA